MLFFTLSYKPPFHNQSTGEFYVGFKNFMAYLIAAFLWTFVTATNAWSEPSKEIQWSDLIPKGYEPEKLLEKYEKDIERLNNLPDNSDEGIAIIQRITEEINNSPMNKEISGQHIRIAGYIAPLDIKNGMVTRFLLVPYFGACIHVPPPPMNQTILVQTAPRQGIKLHEVDYPYLISGQLSIQKTHTDIGQAGYQIKNAQTALHKDSVWLEEER